MENNRCIVCGKPCRMKYCDDCKKEARKQYYREYMKGKRAIKYKGCNEDCMNCPYPDCLKPTKDMRPTRDVTDLRRVDYGTGESQSKMYTVELGKVNTIMPNVSRSYFK